MHRLPSRLLLLGALLSPLTVPAAAQDIAPPIPQKLTLHSKLLNEDRIVWVRTPRGYGLGKDLLPVLYLTDGPGHINEIGSTIDFLVDNGRMPPLIVVGIANTDRVRDLTPSRADVKNEDGSVDPLPTSGGGDHFFDFIQQELMPEIEKLYRAAPYRIFAGHSLGGLMAIHILTSRPDAFQAYIAVSPSLWWDDQRVVHQAQQFFAAHSDLNKMLFFSLGGEGKDMQDGFEQLRTMLRDKAPANFHWDSVRFPDETHSSTVLRAHYAGLRTVFFDWEMPRDEKGFPLGGLDGIEKHYRDLSARYDYSIPVPENALNGLGYQLMQGKKFDEAIAIFRRNVSLYPGSANVYDSLGEGYESAGKYDLAVEQFQKAVAVGTKTNDPNLSSYSDHIKRVNAEMKKASDNAAGHK